MGIVWGVSTIYVPIGTSVQSSLPSIFKLQFYFYFLVDSCLVFFRPQQKEKTIVLTEEIIDFKALDNCQVHEKYAISYFKWVSNYT